MHAWEEARQSQGWKLRTQRSAAVIILTFYFITVQHDNPLTIETIQTRPMPVRTREPAPEPCAELYHIASGEQGSGKRI